MINIHKETKWVTAHIQGPSSVGWLIQLLVRWPKYVPGYAFEYDTEGMRQRAWAVSYLRKTGWTFRRAWLVHDEWTRHLLDKRLADTNVTRWPASTITQGTI